jgi:hypothetical protein
MKNFIFFRLFLLSGLLTFPLFSETNGRTIYSGVMSVSCNNFSPSGKATSMNNGFYLDFFNISDQALSVKVTTLPGSRIISAARVSGASTNVKSTWEISNYVFSGTVPAGSFKRVETVLRCNTASNCTGTVVDQSFTSNPSNPDLTFSTNGLAIWTATDLLLKIEVTGQTGALIARVNSSCGRGDGEFQENVLGPYMYEINGGRPF